MSKLLLLGLSLFQVISVNMQLEDVMHLSGPSGEFTSPGYPNTQPRLDSWNITVDEDRRIVLQFIDFGLFETDVCHLDVFELYDGAFNTDLLIGKWCWDSFDKLNTTTYISSGNVFIVRFRAIEGHSRKGFKAYYSSISKEVTTNNTADIVLTTVPDELSTVPTTSTQNVPKQGTTNTTENVSLTTPDELPNVPTTSTQNATTPDVSTILTTSGQQTIPSSSVTSAQTAVSTDTLTTETTDKTDSTNDFSLRDYVILAAGVGGGILLIIVLCCLAVCCCCICSRDKRKTQDSSKSTETEFQVLAGATPVQSSEDPVEESFSVKSPNSSQKTSTGKDKNSAPFQTVDGAYSSPTYATPIKKKKQVQENSKHASQLSKGNENKGKSKELFTPDYESSHGVERESAEFEINVAYQSCDSDKENGWDTEQMDNEYTYVENTNISTHRSQAAPRVEVDDVTYSLPEEEGVDSEILVPNIAYQTFDLEDEQEQEREGVDMTTNAAYQSCDLEDESERNGVTYSLPEESVEMTTNLAYQSCDSEAEEKGGKNDATYYYVDGKGSDKLEKQIDVVYESI